MRGGSCEKSISQRTGSTQGKTTCGKGEVQDSGCEERIDDRKNHDIEDSEKLFHQLRPLALLRIIFSADPDVSCFQLKSENDKRGGETDDRKDVSETVIAVLVFVLIRCF